MSASGGKADMTGCGCLLFRSLRRKKKAAARGVIEAAPYRAAHVVKPSAGNLVRLCRIICIGSSLTRHKNIAMHHYEFSSEFGAMQYLMQFLSIQTFVGFLIGYGLRALISQIHRAEARRARTFY